MKKTKTLIGLLATICALVAIFTLFCTAFGNVGEFPSSRGSAFDVMFGSQSYDAVPGMIAAFVILCVAAFVLLAGSLLPSKLAMIVLGVGSVLSLVGAIMLFFAPGMFQAVAGSSLEAEVPTLGIGLILPAIFGILGGLIGLLGARNAMKE